MRIQYEQSIFVKYVNKTLKEKETPNYGNYANIQNYMGIVLRCGEDESAFPDVCS